MKREIIKVIMKLYLNDEARTTKSVLSEPEFKLIPKLVNDEIIYVNMDNPNYHYVNRNNKVARAVESQLSLLTEIL
jgi:hypothetical protein